jgi:hypothetical protein
MTIDMRAQTRATPGTGNEKPERNVRNNNMFALVAGTKTKGVTLHCTYRYVRLVIAESSFGMEPVKLLECSSLFDEPKTKNMR